MPKKQAVPGSIATIYILVGKYTGEQHTYHAAYAVAGEYIKRIINGGAGTPLYHQVAYYCGYNTNSQRMRHRNITCRRGNSYQTNHSAYAGTHCRWLFSTEHIKKYPG